MKQGNTKIAGHYREEYFNNYQKEFGEFGGRANKFMFEKHISGEDAVLDFGCGGGFLLKNLNCRERTGIEINPIARDYCNHVNGIRCLESLEFIPNESIDVVISSHCLEHTTNPFELITLLFEKLRNQGKIIIVVPLDSYQFSWTPNDVDNHLYSFSPMNLGNILQGVGFQEIKTEAVLHKWVPGFKTIDQVFGLNTFHQLSWLYGKYFNKRYVQVKGYGIKK
ncbi:MAG: class I SAM-dependent methyltransferase [Cyclobacteriaceae bacterium]